MSTHKKKHSLINGVVPRTPKVTDRAAPGPRGRSSCTQVPDRAAPGPRGRSSCTQVPDRTFRVVASGADGVVVERYDGGSISSEYPFAKLYWADKPTFDVKLHTLLHRNDKQGVRFGRYKAVAVNRVLQPEQIAEIEQAAGRGVRSRMTLSPKYEAIGPQGLTRTQWRYLRRSVERLGELGIIHGDLPGNVMINPANNDMPVIIDFAQAAHYPNGPGDTLIGFQATTFQNHFKVGKPLPAAKAT